MKKLLLPLLFVGFSAVAQAEPYLDIHEIKTPKNLSVWFVQDRTIPVMTLKFSLKGGSRFDPVHKEGSAELLSTLLDEGAGNYDGEAFQDALDNYSVKMGFNATRDGFYGTYKTTIQYADKANELFDAALNKPHLSPEAINRMRDALQSQLRFQMTDPDYMAGRALFETIFKDQGYARPVEGTATSLAAIARNDIVQIRKDLFCREHLKISVVGDLAEKDVAALTDRFFGSWPSCDRAADDKAQTLTEAGKTIRVKRDGAQASIILAQSGLARQDKDWWAARILDFALGAGQFSSRLMEEVRVKRGLTYGVSTSLVPYDAAPLWLVQAGVDPSKADEAVAVIKKIWADVAANGLTEVEIKEAKEYMIGSLPLALTSIGDIASILLQLQEDGLPKNTLDVRAAEINAVTSQDIARVAKQRLDAQALTTIIVGK